MPKNLIQHHEWNTRDPKRLASFYSRIFDWKFDDRKMPGYTFIDGIGGLFEIPPEMGEMPTGVVNYVNVDDLEAKEKLIRAAGGSIKKSKQEVPNMGWFTIFTDPDNNLMAMWQPMSASGSGSAKKSASGSAKKPAKKASSKRRR